MTGQVVERRVDLGAPVGREGQESEIYVIADLSSLWVDLACRHRDLANIAVGLTCHHRDRAKPVRAVKRKYLFVSPLLNADTRSAKVIATLDNADMAWRPGFFVTAQITTAEQPVDLCVPEPPCKPWRASKFSSCAQRKDLRSVRL